MFGACSFGALVLQYRCDSVGEPLLLSKVNDMLNTKIMHAILQELAEDRPIFHSEDDFKFALAWKIKTRYSQSDIRLEYPVRTPKRKDEVEGDRYIDLLVTFGKSQFPIELKYKTMECSSEINGEVFRLTEHHGRNENRYRFGEMCGEWKILDFPVVLSYS